MKKWNQDFLALCNSCPPWATVVKGQLNVITDVFCLNQENYALLNAVNTQFSWKASEDSSSVDLTWAFPTIDTFMEVHLENDYEKSVFGLFGPKFLQRVPWRKEAFLASTQELMDALREKMNEKSSCTTNKKEAPMEKDETLKEYQATVDKFFAALDEAKAVSGRTGVRPLKAHC